MCKCVQLIRRCEAQFMYVSAANKFIDAVLAIPKKKRRICVGETVHVQVQKKTKASNQHHSPVMYCLRSGNIITLFLLYTIIIQTNFIFHFLYFHVDAYIYYYYIVFITFQIYIKINASKLISTRCKPEITIFSAKCVCVCVWIVLRFARSTDQIDKIQLFEWNSQKIGMKICKCVKIFRSVWLLRKYIYFFFWYPCHPLKCYFNYELALIKAQIVFVHCSIH